MRPGSAGSVTTLLAVVLALLLPQAASAHRASNYYEATWPIPATGERVLDWAFTPTFEDAARADAIAATEAWNRHAGALTFRNVADHPVDTGPSPCPLIPTSTIERGAVNIARRGSIDGPEGGILAIAATCNLGGVAYHFTVTYDESEPWHFGPPPIAYDTFDLQGILAHEFGHTTGWFRHFEENTGVECLDLLRHTMCSTVAPGNLDPRDLEPHDIDTWRNAY